jgi:nitrite reductase/ring-hydroxylating ferredoxin subunit
LRLVGRVPRSRLLTEDLVRLEYPPWNVLVAWVRGEPRAIEDACNHAGASLVEGHRDGDKVVCPLHGYVFSLETGDLLSPKGLCEDQRRFVTLVEGDEVAVYDPFELRIENIEK